ncbi:hypothetical protein FNV43_RR00911 [Rhamnella rubrinervis]|uniref:Pectinesterase n=1 Tax=Rhamnella rubrinervis TaxID=2594499 RepID=A0A8K0MRK7_9ROSA|nr:hypothetical protein FNV43_RR00911 [Rhamnella rubrinervis]
MAGNDGNQKKKKIAIMGASALILVAMVVAVAVGVNKGGSDDHHDSGSKPSTSSKAVQTICQPTDYRETCESSLSSAAGNTTDPKELIKTGFQVAVDQLKAAMKNSSTLKELAKDPRANQALENCEELMDYAIDDLQESFTKLGAFDVTKLDEYVEDLKVWLGGAVTYEQTCLDGFENTTGEAGERMKSILKTAQELTSNGLAMVTEIYNILMSSNINVPAPQHRRLLNEEEETPSWVNERKRKLLAATPSTIKADVVVAKDGSGKYKTVNEALNDIPKNSNTTFVIYIKEGVYAETVILDKTKTHVMMIGDGPTKSVITGNKNWADGVQTFKTATVSIIGSNFIAKDMGFENSAGAEKHQAVALRVQSDLSIFYNCQMDGYQDTLYTHAHRQFYRDCTISGTIDFIFGDAAVVFQNCKMIVRKPMDTQSCIVTAQGRTDRRSPSAIILQNCAITGDPEYLAVKDVNKAYLGRPWKPYSRTIIMQSQIDGMIQPEGWMPWAGDFGINTCFYSEFNNRGPGSDTSKRAKWKGVKTMTPEHAVDFTPGRFLRGDTWIKPTGIPYISGMVSV